MYITLNEAIGILTLVIISIQAGFNLAKYIFKNTKNNCPTFQGWQLFLTD